MAKLTFIYSSARGFAARKCEFNKVQIVIKWCKIYTHHLPATCLRRLIKWQ